MKKLRQKFYKALLKGKHEKAAKLYRRILKKSLKGKNTHFAD